MGIYLCILICLVIYLIYINVKMTDRNERLANAGEHTRKKFIELNEELNKAKRLNEIRDNIKNFEKYQNELISIIDSDDDFFNMLNDFCKKHCINSTDNLIKELFKWLYDDCDLSELFSVEEINILRMLGNQYRWVGRTKNGKLFISTVEIPKYYIDDCVIVTPDLYKYIEMFNDSFKNVTYENSPIRFR